MREEAWRLHLSAVKQSSGVLHRPTRKAGAPTRKRVPPTTIGRSFRNMLETLRNVGGTSGVEQLNS